jgi:hypothetical protein
MVLYPNHKNIGIRKTPRQTKNIQDVFTTTKTIINYVTILANILIDISPVHIDYNLMSDL